MQPLRLGALSAITAMVLGTLTGSVTADAPIQKILYGADKQVILRGRLTSTMGPRQLPNDKLRFHTGIDLAAPKGSPIFAPADGRVITVSESARWGKVVVLLTGGDTTTRFAHLDASLVTEGQTVRAGELIARVGSSGQSTGPHVHIETYVDGERVDPMTVWHLSLAGWRQF